jgi:hypothetical protein
MIDGSHHDCALGCELNSVVVKTENESAQQLNRWQPNQAQTLALEECALVVVIFV